MLCEFKSLNRTYTISKENNTNEGGILERQKWDKQYNITNSGLNSERKHEMNVTPTWVECASENP